jgi:hypothetical protein
MINYTVLKRPTDGPWQVVALEPQLAVHIKEDLV